MAGNRQQFTLQFNADTSQAKKAVSDLMNSLKEVTKNNSLSLNINADLIKGAEAAQELETHLRSAVNVNTGQLNLVAFNKSLQQSGQSLSTLVTNLANAGSTGQQAFINLATAISQTQVPLRQTNALINNMMTTLKNTVKWELSSSVVHGLSGALSGAVSYVKELNSSLTDIRIVTGQSADDMAKFAVQANRAAKELSTTTKAYANASLIYYQQGDNAEQVAKKAAITIKAANASFNSSAQEMSEYLTSVWNSYQVGADELEHYVDIMAALGSKTATSLEEIATSMQKVAATANTVGISMEQVSSIISTVSSVTRESAESIGTSYKTIFARIGDLKMGSTLEDGVKLGQVSAALDKIGIKILDTNNEMRDMGAIIEEIGAKWQTMSRAEQTALAQIIAGKRQYTQLMALFENWNMYQSNMNIAENSEGSLERMAQTYAESWEAASARVRASMETIYSALINDKAIIKMTNTIAEITNGVGGFVKALGGAKGIISVIGAALLKSFSGKIVSNITTMTNSIVNLVQGPAKQYAAVLAQTNKVLGDTADGQNKASISSTSQLIALKQTLLEKEQYLTTSQQMTMQAGLDAYAGQIAKLRELETVYEDISVDLDGLAIKLGKLGGAQLDGLLSHLTTVSDRWSLLYDSSFIPSSNKAGALTTQIAKNWTKASITEGIADNAQEKVSDEVLNNLDNATQKTNQYAKALEQLKQVTEGTKLSKLFDGFEADKLTSGEQKVQDLRNAISQLSKAAETDAAALSDALKRAIDNPTLGDELINSLKEIQKELASGQTDATTAFARVQQLFVEAESKAESLKNKLASLPTTIQKVVQSSAQIASGLMSAVSAGNSLANAMALVGDESASTAEKIGAFASFASVGLMGISSMISAVYSLATAFGVAKSAAGWIGLIGAAIAATVTGITYAVQKAEKEVQAAAEQISEDLNEMNTKSQTQQEEYQSAQSLLKTYNELYEQYLRGEDVQDKLAASAQALAEAYGITGAAVAAITGDYEAFNQVLLKTLKISDLITEDEGIISASAASWQEMSSNKKSGISSTSNTIIRQQADTIGGSGAESLYAAAIQWNNVMSSSPYDLMTNYINEAIKVGLISLPENMTLEEYVNKYFEALYPNQSNIYTRHGYDIEGNNTILTPNASSWETFLYNDSGLTPEVAQWIDLQMGLAHGNSSLGAETKANGAVYFSDRYDLTNGMINALQQQDTSYATTEKLIPLGAEYGKYLSDNNIVYWDENADIQTAYETYTDYNAWYTELIAEKNRLLAEDADADISYLTSIIDQLEPIVKNSDYETLFSNYGQALARKAANEAALANIQFLIGRNEENTDFNSFVTGYQDVENTVRQNSEDYVELKDLDPVADKEEYDAAVQKIATGLINDYTSFNDYMLIYSSLAESFVGDNFNQALDYIQHNKIKSASEVNGSLLQAMGMALNLGQELIGNTLVDSVLAANQADQKASESRDKYERMLTSSKTLSENMSLDEAETFYDTYWNAGIKNIMAWEDFILLDYDARKSYINSITDDYLKTAQTDAENAKALAETALSNWETAYSDLYGNEDSDLRKQWEDASAYYKDFESSVLKNYTQQEDGSYKYVGPEGTENSAYTYLLNKQGVKGAFNQYYKDQTGSDTNLSEIGITVESIQDYNEATATGIALTNEFNDAVAGVNAFNLITSGAESATTAMQRLINAIQNLPTDAEELSKIADALGWDMNKLVNSTAAERAEAVAAAIEKPELQATGKYSSMQEYLDAHPEMTSTIEGQKKAQMHWMNEFYSTPEDYAQYLEKMGLYQEANALNAQYKEQAIRDGMIQTLSDVEELSSVLSSIDITDLPEQGAKAYDLLSKALDKASIKMSDFMKMSDSEKYTAIAKAQNKLIDDQITLNTSLQEHYASIMNDTTETYDEDTRMQAAQDYYDTVVEGNNLILQQEQNIANAREQASDVYAQQADMMKARMEDAKSEAEKFKSAAEEMSDAIETGALSETAKQTLSQAGYLDDWEKAASATERAAIASKAWSKYAADTAKAGEELSASYNTVANILKNKDQVAQYKNQSDARSKDGKSVLNLQNRDDYLQYLRDYTDMTETQLGHVREAWDNLGKQGIDLSNMTNKEITEALTQELINMGVKVDQTWQITAANAKDAMADIGKSMAQDHIEAAQTAADAWLNAFQQIAEARKTLLSGGSLLEQIAGDPAQILQYSRSSGLSPQEVARQIMSGNLTARQLQFGSYDDYINTQMANYGLDQENFGTKNIFSDTLALGYHRKWNSEDNTIGWADVNGNFINQETINGALEEYYSAILQTTGLTQKDAQKLARQIINSEAEYGLLSNARGELIQAIEASATAQEMWTKQQEAETAVQSVEIKDQTATMNGHTASYSELTDLQAAIERAQDAKYNNESWESLSSADRELLNSFGISFDNVDSAAINCANALLACAEAALALAKAAANDQGYYENSAGNYQQAMTEQEYASTYGNTFSGGEEEARTYYQSMAVAEGAEFTTNAQGESLLFIGKESDAITSAIKSATDAVENFRTTSESATENNIEKMASSVDMTTEEFKEFTDAMIQAGAVTAKTTEGQYEQARSLARIQKGLKTVRDSMKDWKKELSSAKGDVQAYNKVLSKMRRSFEDVLDMPIGSLSDLSEEFMTSAETAELLKGAMDGDVDAYNKLQAAVAKEFAIGEGVTVSPDIQNAIDTIATEMDNLPINEPIEFGKLATVSPALYDALSSYVGAIAAAGGDVQAAAAALGFDLQYTTKEVPIEAMGPQYSVGGSFTTKDGTFTTVNASLNKATGMYTVTAIKAITNKGTHGGNIGGSSSRGGGGGGGGGGKEPKKLDKKDPNDEKKRYFQIENSLERLADALERVDKIKKRAYGETYLKNLESEISLIKQEIGLQEEYIKQAKEWLAFDKERVASLGATFDGEGNIANYDELMDSILEKYNAFIDKYNAASASAQEKMEEEKEQMDEWYENAMEWIDQYQETLGLIYDKQNEILELQNQISEKTLEKIQYKVEYKVEINEAEKDYLDYLNDKYDEVLEKQDLLMDNYIRQAQLAEQNLGYLATAREELEAAYAAGELNQADYVAGLQDIQSQILENLETIQEMKELIEELYGKTLDLASEELDKHVSKIEAASEAMGSYMSILQLMGKGQNFKDLLFFYEKQYEYNMASLESQMSYLEVLKEEEQYYLARMNSAQGLTETERIQYEALQETMNQVQADILSKTEETLQALKDMYNTTIEDIMKNLEESMVGVGNDLAWLTEEYGFYMEEMEQYVSSQRELYEISKLNRNIQKSINDTTSAVHKKQLKALQDEINAQSELKELSEYEIEMMNLKYELLLKQIALEEAQNAKNTVRLTRDSEGNMVYQYTANQDEINQAQQEYEDVLQQMVDTNWEYEQDIYNQTLQLRQDTLNAIKEIAMDETLTEEQKQQRISEIMEHYYNRSQYLQEQYQIVTGNTMATNEIVAEHYGVAISDINDRTKDTIAEIIGEMINDTDNYRQEMENAYTLIKQAMQEYANKIDAVTTLTNTNYGSMIESVKTYDKVTEDAKKQTAAMTQTLQTESCYDGCLGFILEKTSECSF